MSLEKELKKICDDWLNIHRKTGYVPLALIKMRLLSLQPDKLNSTVGGANFRKSFSELVDLNIKLHQFKIRFISASDETKELIKIAVNETVEKDKNEQKKLGGDYLENLLKVIEKALSDAQNAAQDLQELKPIDYPSRVCLLAKNLAFLAGFEKPLPKNVSTDNGFGLFLSTIFEIVGEYNGCQRQDVVNAWHRFNRKWIF